MEYAGPDIRLAEEEEREAIIASLDSLSFTEAYKAVKEYERALYLTKYLENKPNRKDIIKSFIDTTWTKEQSLNENISRSQYIRLITAIWTSKIIWDNSNKEDRIFILNFLIEEFMPKLLERFNLLLSEWGQPGIDNKKLGLNAIHERWIDIISSFYADIFKDYKILEHGGHHPVKYRRYTGGYFIQHIVIDPEKFIDNLKILRKLIIEVK